MNIFGVEKINFMISLFSKIKIISQGGYCKIISSKRFGSGENILKCSPSKSKKKRTTRTIQIRDNLHIQNFYLDYINHSCNPNMFFDTSQLTFKALREIYLGEELTFFYPGSETKLANNFFCECNSPRCLKYITGAFEMDKNDLEIAYVNGYFTSYIKSKLQESNYKLPCISLYL